MSRRDQIAMSPEEVTSFLDRQRVVICATNGLRGWPHLMPLWYVLRGDDVWAWTYAKSQKVRNLERDPRATLQIESGGQYHELKGVMIEAKTVIHRDLGPVSEFGAELFRRYSGDRSSSGDAERAGDEGASPDKGASPDEGASGDKGASPDEGASGEAGDPEFLEVIRAQAAKRVALQFVAERTASWDHGKLGGTY